MPENQEEKLGFLGRFLDKQLTPERTRTWRIVFFLALAVIALLNIIIRNHHPHFGVDAYPFFWVLFGLIVGVVLVFLVKKIIQPLIKRSEDYYGDL
jgi:TRAP-type C4-dicarboxylate transport system permease small subunit